MSNRFLALFGLATLSLASTSAFAGSYTISAADAKALHGQDNVVFWFAGNDAAYEKGHIPGSVHAFTHDMQYLDDVQSCDGLPMCPDRAAAFLGNLGIGNDTTVIAYEDGKGVNESGAWFFLNLYGHTDVKIMEGGIHDWQAAGGAIETGSATASLAKKTFTAKVNKSMIATAADVEKAQSAGLILDARHTFEEYTGQDKKDGMKNASEHITVAKGGHIPGAVFSPWSRYAGNKTGVAGRPVFKSASSIQGSLTKLEAKGYAKDKEVITYCHVGLGRGSFQYMGLKAAGHDNVKLYIGSWSEWGNSSRPVATK